MTDHLITTTMVPGKVVSVNDQELLDLTRMGVVESRVPSGLDQVPQPTPLVSAMQAGGAQQEVSSGHEQEADSGGPAQATGQ
jgi:hypothetical protein